MPKYIIERGVPGAGKSTPEQLQAMAQKSNAVLDSQGTQIHWLHSYVTNDKIYCVYIAPDEKMILDHAKKSGFPADKITRVATIIDPETAELEVPVI